MSQKKLCHCGFPHDPKNPHKHSLSQPTIREEFEKAFEAHHPNGTHYTKSIRKDAALWAAEWMAERLAIYAEKSGEDIIDNDEIRQLAKELE